MIKEQDEEVLDSSSDEEGSDQPEEATSQEAVSDEPKEPPFHEHPRFKELISEKNELKETNRQLQSQLMQIVGNKGDTKEQVQEKIYEANTPEEREFWQRVEKLSEQKAQTLVKGLEEKFQQERDALYQQYGKLAANQFLRDNPDVKQGSEELKEIVQYARSYGVPLEDAKKIVLFEASQEAAAAKVKQKQQLKLKEKQAANLETKSVPQGSLPDPEDQSLDEAFEDNWKKLMGEG